MFKCINQPKRGSLGFDHGTVYVKPGIAVTSEIVKLARFLARPLLYRNLARRPNRRVKLRSAERSVTRLDGLQ